MEVICCPGMKLVWRLLSLIQRTVCTSYWLSLSVPINYSSPGADRIDSPLSVPPAVCNLEHATVALHPHLRATHHITSTCSIPSKHTNLYARTRFILPTTCQSTKQQQPRDALTGKHWRSSRAPAHPSFRVLTFPGLTPRSPWSRHSALRLMTSWMSFTQGHGKRTYRWVGVATVSPGLRRVFLGSDTPSPPLPPPPTNHWSSANQKYYY